MYRRRFLWLALVMLPALMIAALVYKGHPETDIFNTPNGTWTIASNLVKGYGYTTCDSSYFPFCSETNNATAMREPVPVLLMALARMVRPSHDSGLLMQIILYLGTIPVIFYLLKRENIRLAVVASILWIFSVPVINEIVNDAGHLAAVLFYMTGIYFFMRGLREEKTSQFVLAGVLMGLAALSRTILMGTALGVGGIMVLMQVVLRNKRQFWNGVLFLGMIVVAMSPWVIRNKIVFGSPVIGSTLTGYNIYRMNYFLGEEPFRPHYVGADEAYAAFSVLVQNGDLSGFENEAQMDDFYAEAGKQIILQYPLRYIELSLYRFLILWFNVSVDAAYGTRMYTQDYLGLLEQGLFLFFGLVGAFKRYRDYWPLVVTVVLGSAAYMAVNAQLRYLVDLMPSIVILVALSLPHFDVTRKLKKHANRLLKQHQVTVSSSSK